MISDRAMNRLTWMVLAPLAVLSTGWVIWPLYTRFHDVASEKYFTVSLSDQAEEFLREALVDQRFIFLGDPGGINHCFGQDMR
jgi:hypothetical protein